MSFKENLKKLNLLLPEAKPPVGNYVAYKISGKMLFISGQISIDENGELIKGKVGKDLDTQAGYNAAKRCALSIVAQVKSACNDDLSKIKSCTKLTGFVNSTETFVEQPKGELTIVISEKINKFVSHELSESDKNIIKKMINLLSIKEIVTLICKNNQVSKKEIYNYCLLLKNEN